MTRRPKRDKRYRPKPIGRPITGAVRDELVLPAYVALQTVQFGTDKDAQESARHTLAALFDYMLIALRDAGQDAATIEVALGALIPMIRRYDAGQNFRATADEMVAVRAGVEHADRTLGTLKSHQIIGAVIKVNALIDAGVVANDRRSLLPADTDS